MSEPNAFFMAEAIRLAVEGVNSNRGGPFGAVVVQGGQIISRRNNRVTSTNDPTAHAEIVAIREACRTLGTFQLAGCEIYASCEPCPMCLAAIYWARIDRLYYGAAAADAHAIGFSDEMICQQLTLPCAERSLPAIQLMRDEALAAFAAWQAKPDRVPY